MFRFISHHLQGEITYSLLKNISFYTAIIYSTLAASLYVKDKNFVGLQYFYKG